MHGLHDIWWHYGDCLTTGGGGLLSQCHQQLQGDLYTVKQWQRHGK